MAAANFAGGGIYCRVCQVMRGAGNLGFAGFPVVAWALLASCLEIKPGRPMRSVYAA
jgi:hypothetical protein